MKRKDEYIAIYLRLSDEDGEQGESNSIKNQRILLREYIQRNPEFSKKGQIISGKCAKQVIFYLIWHRERVCGVISTVMRKYCQSVRKSGFLRDSFL